MKKGKVATAARLGMREWCMLDPTCPESPHRTTAASVSLSCLPGKLPESQNTFQIHCSAPPARGNNHRLLEVATGCWGTYRHKKIAGRHYRVPVGTKFLQETVLTANSKPAVHSIEFLGKCMHGHTPYHAMDSREHGPRPPGHQSRISMHDGPKAKLATLISNEMHTNKREAQPLSWWFRRQDMHAKCNLNMWTKHATWT